MKQQYDHILNLINQRYQCDYAPDDVKEFRNDWIEFNDGIGVGFRLIFQGNPLPIIQDAICDQIVLV